MGNNRYHDLGEFEAGVAELELGINESTVKFKEQDNKDGAVINLRQPAETDEVCNDQGCVTYSPTGYCCIEVDDICINYSNKKIIENVSLKIVKNAVTAIIGPSGCGKSSFLCCINKLTDLIPHCQVSGCIKFEWDEHIKKKKTNILRSHVGMLFQKPNPFPFSIWRNLEFPLREHGVTDAYEISVKIKKALSDVGLWEEVKERLHTSALTLSGGQQQRLCLARALILEPSVLLMDEPCSALDPMATQKIEELIERLAESMTVILVTHNLSQAKRVADYVALFWKDNISGKLIEFSPVKEFFEHPKHDLTRTYLNYG